MKENMNPELLDAFSKLPKWDLTDINKQRKINEELLIKKQIPSNPDILEGEQFIPRSREATKLRVKTYRPKGNEDVLPGVLYMHGGGFVMGSAEDNRCYRYAREVNCVVISVDYRLAPENPFPAGLEDCYDALTWFYENANELGVDKSRIAIVGPSGGGGLTAALSLLARDRKGPPIVFQMPLYPMIDDRNKTLSSHQITDDRAWNRDTNIKAWEMYLGNNKENVSSYAAVSRAKDYSGLPPTYTCVGELDLFRDETIEYVTQLVRAGVPTEFHIYPGCFHGFDTFVPHAEISKRAVSEYISALKIALYKS